MKLFSCGHPYSGYKEDDAVILVGYFKTKAAFCQAFDEMFDTKNPLLEKESKQEFNEIKKELSERHRGELLFDIFAQKENENKLIACKYQIFTPQFWKRKIEDKDAVFPVKIIPLKDYEKLQEQMVLLEKSKNYETLKKKLIELAENLKNDEPNFLV